MLQTLFSLSGIARKLVLQLRESQGFLRGVSDVPLVDGWWWGNVVASLGTHHVQAVETIGMSTDISSGSGTSRDSDVAKALSDQISAVLRQSSISSEKAV